jgi:two-component system sensor histidine kinase/response regulator
VLRERHAAKTPFRLVLTDVNMPDVDGLMLCEQIRGMPELADLTLVVLTSGDRAGDHSLCKQLAVAAHLLKPVKPSELLRVVLRVLGKGADREETDTGRSEPTAANMTKSLRVLLAEDSVVNQKLAVGLLNKWGHTVHAVDTGLAAVEAWERESFDLILMDVQMPEMNGLEATAAIRQREAQTGGHIPIIALTAHALEGDRDQCLAAGMDDYVPKPLRHPDLRRTILRCCFDTEEEHSAPSGTVDQ